MSVTSIEWTDRTWNVVRGCSRVSPGCDNCYAIGQARRQDKPGKAYEGLTRVGAHGLDWSGVVRLVPELLEEPLHWRKPQRIFVNSMSDLFHESLQDDEIDRVFAAMALAREHTFQILTKRPSRMRVYLDSIDRDVAVTRACRSMSSPTAQFISMTMAPVVPVVKGRGLAGLMHANLEAEKGPVECVRTWPLPNVWLGTSIENEDEISRILPLLETPAALHFLSLEPLLGPLPTLRRWLTCSYGGRSVRWVIVGGESGTRARPCDVAWIRSAVEQCKAAGTACFVKQLGARPHVGEDGAGPAHDFASGGDRHWRMDDRSSGKLHVYEILSRKGGDPSEWPEDLRVREFPS